MKRRRSAENSNASCSSDDADTPHTHRPDSVNASSNLHSDSSLSLSSCCGVAIGNNNNVKVKIYESSEQYTEEKDPPRDLAVELDSKAKKNSREILSPLDLRRKIVPVCLQIASEPVRISSAQDSENRWKDFEKLYVTQPGDLTEEQMFHLPKQQAEQDAEWKFESDDENNKKEYIKKHGNILSIIGWPGIGKTTSMKKWIGQIREGKLVSGVKYLFFIFVRYIDFTKKMNLLQFLLSSIIPNWNHSRKADKAWTDKIFSNPNVLIALEGIDEAAVKDMTSRAPRVNIYDPAEPLHILLNLFNGSLLPLARIVISSRPDQLYHLHPEHRPKCIVQILGLSQNARDELGFSLWGGKYEQIRVILEKNPGTFAYCVVPVNFLLTVDYLISENEVDFVCMTRVLSAACEKYSVSEHLRGIECELDKLSKLAWYGYQQMKVLFQKEDLQQTNLSKNTVRSFLNISVVKSANIKVTIMDGHTRNYFSHLIWQEYFVAVYLMLFAHDDFDLHIKEIFKDRGKVVAKFLFGLCNLAVFEKLKCFKKSCSKKLWDSKRSKLKNVAISSMRELSQPLPAYQDMRPSENNSQPVTASQCDSQFAANGNNQYSDNHHQQDPQSSLCHPLQVHHQQAAANSHQQFVSNQHARLQENLHTPVASQQMHIANQCHGTSATDFQRLQPIVMEEPHYMNDQSFVETQSHSSDTSCFQPPTVHELNTPAASGSHYAQPIVVEVLVDCQTSRNCNTSGSATSITAEDQSTSELETLHLPLYETHSATSSSECSGTSSSETELDSSGDDDDGDNDGIQKEENSDLSKENTKQPDKTWKRLLQICSWIHEANNETTARDVANYLPAIITMPRDSTVFPGDVSDLFYALQFNSKPVLRVTPCNFTGNSLTIFCEEVANCNVQIVSFDRSRKKISNEDFFSIVNCSEHVQELILQDCAITRRKIRALAEKLQIKGHTIEFLDLSFNNINDKIFSCLVNCLHNIRELNLQNCGISSIACKNLADKVTETGHKIQFLNLGGNKICDEGFSYLIGSLQNFQRLALFDCGITRDGCAQLPEKLNETGHTIQLDLGKNKIGDTGLSFLIKCLHNIQELKLEHCGITWNGCEMLAEKLVHARHTIQFLVLGSNKIENEGFSHLIKCLQYIRKLGVWACDITGTQLEELAKKLNETRCTLQLLDLSLNWAICDEARSLIPYLNLIEELRLNGCFVTKDVQEDLKTELKRLNLAESRVSM